MEKLEWERVCDFTERLRVPGGWLVHCWSNNGCMSFVSDTNHEWKL